MVKTSTLKTYAKLTLSGLAISACAFSLSAAQDSGDANAEEYATLLQQIADTKLTIAHQEVYIASQEAKIADLEAQIESAGGLVESVGPMLDKMAAAISDEIDADIPFKSEERFNRLGDFQDTVADAEALPADKMRKALNIYNAEVAYGQTMEAYDGDHPNNPGGRYAACLENASSSTCALSEKQVERMEEDGVTIEQMKNELKDGSYLRYGRMALVYNAADNSETLRYDPTAKAWERVTGGRALDIRRAVRIAKGESAPGVVEAPIYLAN